MSNRVTTPFTAESTAAEVVDGVDLSGRRVVVTGASSGIGIETARALASAGAEVTFAVRDVAAGEAVAAGIDGRAAVAPLDLADRSSIAAFVGAWSGPLHVLVNNAGVMSLPHTLTADGWEMHFAVNHLGHFALATGLHRALAAAGGAPEQGAATSVLLAASPLVEGVGGRYFEDANESERVAPHALDPEAADRLWGLSVQALG